MNKRILACAALLFAAFSPAMACQPLAEIAEQLQAMGVTKDQVISFPDADIAERYLDKAGIGVPFGSSPIGIIVGLAPPYTAVGIVEPGRCVTHTAAISYELHLRVMEFILDSI